MMTLRIIIRKRRTAGQTQIIKETIEATIKKNGVVVSHAKTAREICETVNYNRSIEIPVCGMGKL